MGCGCGRRNIASMGTSAVTTMHANKTNTAVLVRYTGPGEPHTLLGAATGYNYGTRQYGDVFQAWSGDVEAAPGLFEVQG